MNRKCMKYRLLRKKFSTQKRNFCIICFNTKSFIRKFRLCKKHIFLQIRKGLLPGFKVSSF